MEERELKFRERILARLILKAAQKKKERVMNASLQQPGFFINRQNMN